MPLRLPWATGLDGRFNRNAVASAGATPVVGQFEVTIWMPSQPRRYSDNITEPSAVAPDARLNFVVEQIAEHVKVQLIAKLSLASGATALLYWVPPFMYSALTIHWLLLFATDPLPATRSGLTMIGLTYPRVEATLGFEM